MDHILFNYFINVLKASEANFQHESKVDFQTGQTGGQLYSDPSPIYRCSQPSLLKAQQEHVAL